MAIALTHVSAKCPNCGHKINQIDASQEHAIQVVREAMEKHLDECESPNPEAGA